MINAPKFHEYKDLSEVKNKLELKHQKDFNFINGFFHLHAPIFDRYDIFQCRCFVSELEENIIVAVLTYHGSFLGNKWAVLSEFIIEKEKFNSYFDSIGGMIDAYNFMRNAI